MVVWECQSSSLCNNWPRGRVSRMVKQAEAGPASNAWRRSRCLVVVFAVRCAEGLCLFQMTVQVLTCSPHFSTPAPCLSHRFYRFSTGGGVTSSDALIQEHYAKEVTHSLGPVSVV